MPTIDPEKQAKEETKLIAKLERKLKALLGEYPTNIGMEVIAIVLARAAVMCEMPLSQLQGSMRKAYLQVKQHRQAELDNTAAVLRKGEQN